MPSHFPKLQSGAALGSVLSARYHNEIRDALKWVAAERNRTGRGGAQKTRPPGGVVWIQNNAAAALDRFAILGVDVPAILPAQNLADFRQHNSLKGTTPSAALHSGRFAITLQAIPQGEFGFALLAGVTLVQLNLPAAAAYAGATLLADVANGLCDYLVPSVSGSAQILWHDTPSSYPDTVWAVVRLGNPPPQPVRLATLAADLDPLDNTAQVQLATAGPTYLADNPFLDQGATNDRVAVLANAAGAANPFTLLRVQPMRKTLPVAVGYDTGTGTWNASYQDLYIQGGAAAAASPAPYVGVQPVASNLQKTNSTLTLALSHSTRDYGQQVTLTATVAHTSGSIAPSGAVAFFVDGRQLFDGGTGSFPVGSGGVATNDFSMIPVSLAAHSITAKYLGDQYYNGSVSSAESLTVSAADTSVAIAVVPGAMTYGQAVTITATLTTPPYTTGTGTYTLLDGTTTLSSNTTGVFAGVHLHAGTRAVTVRYNGDANLNTSTSDATDVMVSKAVLTITAASASRLYGDGNPAFLWSLGGFVLGESLASNHGWSGAPTFTTPADVQSGCGSYAITPAAGTLAFDDYSVSGAVAGTLTVNPAPLTLHADNASMAMGAHVPSLSVSSTGIRNGDDLAIAASTTATSSTPRGSYPIVPACGISSANYIVSIINGVLTIT